ncbi:hypothetical protein [Atopomonas hussainii]|uniref:hypothetical protein n=1 Tax=Atopomonas hussainii TaxID=1429083 RepID=UPI000942CB6A|nr:hypothetical protein [Atopomonas hussainii]
MDASWELFVDCTSEKSAITVSRKYLERIEKVEASPQIEAYHKGGFKVIFSTKHKSTSWPDFIYEIMSTAQKASRNWVISGSIAEEVDLWSNEHSVIGVTSVHLQATRVYA